MVIAPVGTAAGAWYIPLDEIVPIAALPPTTPFTAQETAAPVGAPVMVNCWVLVVERLTDEGCIDNCAECGEVTAAAWPPPQPPHVRLKKVIRISAKQLIAGFFPCTGCASASPSDVGMRIGTILGRYVFIYGTLILTPGPMRASRSGKAWCVARGAVLQSLMEFTSPVT
jgi:hypothetical protein